jgi:hypothetical protein
MLTTDNTYEDNYDKKVESMYDYNRLNGIREKIESMTKFNQIEILKILTKTKDVIINENKYGIHINLSDVDDAVIKELEIYINYVTNQENYLNSAEQEKEKYKNTFFLKDNKDMPTY